MCLILFKKKNGQFSKVDYLLFHTPAAVCEDFGCSTSLSNLSISVLLVLDIPLGMKCYFIVVLVCIFPGD